jgi:hypothetical protein
MGTSSRSDISRADRHNNTYYVDLVSRLTLKVDYPNVSKSKADFLFYIHVSQYLEKLAAHGGSVAQAVLILASFAAFMQCNTRSITW